MDSSDFESERIRNICILAHVDHGKTTLADHLIAASGGGVIHPKLAGKLRYMDFLDEEQRRAITMKSSSISLQHNGHLINLIDSPGHIDFCSEVSTAARLSDGALVLVDAVEGVHIQTHAVLRQAWVENLTPCLVINKIDKLLTDLQMTPMEAYTRLLRIVHHVNGIISAFKSEKYLSDVYSVMSSSVSGEVSDENLVFIEDDEEDTFQPQKGNVAFSCALDGWGFTIHDFAVMYAVKIKANLESLQKGLWGPRYYHAPTKTIVHKNKTDVTKSQPMFVQFILHPLWKVLSSRDDRSSLKQVVEAFKLSVPAREMDHKDPRVAVQSVMSRWLNLSNSVLSMVVKFMPSPVSAQSFRVSRLLPKASEGNAARKAVETCDSRADAPCVAFVSKMFTVSRKMVDYEEGEGEECFMAFARVFSGTIRCGMRINVISSLYEPSKGSHHTQEGEVKGLYQMMGQGLKRVPFTRAGNIVAIQGLSQMILKTATLSSSLDCWPFSGMEFQVSPTLRVAIEPSDPSNMAAFVKGLRLLNRADPMVEVTVSSRGEHVLAAAGEVHLERCVKDLRERFAKVSIAVSPPLVSYKETIEGNDDDALSESDYVEKITPNGRCVLRVRVMKLPSILTKILDECSDVVGDDVETQKCKMVEKIKMLTGNTKDQIQKFIKRIWALGPGRVGPNILLSSDRATAIDKKSILVRGSPIVSKNFGFVEEDIVEDERSEEEMTLQNSVVSGFQIATASGPLCDEPLWGLGFDIEAHLSSSEGSEPQGVLSGQVMTVVKEACRSAVLQAKPRFVEAMYFCELNTPTEYLGAMYAVLNRRRARILKEEMREGSPFFTVHAYVPVAESFGFADELRRWTSGASSAMLVMSHWEALADDPFFVPKTEDEIEEFGDGSSVLPNTAKKLINAVRRRKGLPVEEKVVQHATKQRTLARKV